jgi:hypothetical protein
VSKNHGDGEALALLTIVRLMLRDGRLSMAHKKALDFFRIKLEDRA